MVQMIRCMLTDQIDDRYLRAAGIVQISEAVAEAGPEMEKSVCWPLRHAGIAVRCTGYNSFKEAENAAHFRDSVEGGNGMYF